MALDFSLKLEIPNIADSKKSAHNKSPHWIFTLLRYAKTIELYHSATLSQNLYYYGANQNLTKYIAAI